MSASNYLDLGILVFLFFEISRGYAEGCIRTIIGLLGGVCSIVVSYEYTPVLASRLTGDPRIMGAIGGFLDRIVPGSSVPAMSGGIRVSLINNIAAIAIKLLVFLVILFAVRIVASLVGTLLNKLVGSVGGGGADRSLGAVIGGVKGLLWVVVASSAFIAVSRLEILPIPPTVAGSVFFKASGKAAGYLVGLLIENLGLHSLAF